MKLWKALDKALKLVTRAKEELRDEVKLKYTDSNGRNLVVLIKDDPEIVLRYEENDEYNKSAMWFDVRDWELVKATVEGLLNKEA